MQPRPLSTCGSRLPRKILCKRCPSICCCCWPLFCSWCACPPAPLRPTPSTKTSGSPSNSRCMWMPGKRNVSGSMCSQELPSTSLSRWGDTVHFSHRHVDLATSVSVRSNARFGKVGGVWVWGGGVDKDPFSLGMWNMLIFVSLFQTILSGYFRFRQFGGPKHSMNLQHPPPSHSVLFAVGENNQHLKMTIQISPTRRW